MRLIFAGTPDVALPSLDALMSSGHEVAAVLTRPPAPAGRGRAERHSPVHTRALDLGLPVITGSRLSDPEVLGAVRDIAPDCCPVVAFGAMVTPAALAVPPAGWVNLHFSLLPRWRGAAPVQHAVLAGDEQTGATTFRIDAGLDTGPVFGTVTESIRPRDTSGELLARLSVVGSTLLVDTLDRIESGDVAPVPQPQRGVTLAPRIEMDDARIGWIGPADYVDRFVRAMTPAPGAWTILRGERVKIGPVEVAEGGDLAPGEIRGERTLVHVGTGAGNVVLGQVQAHGKRAMAATDWMRGLRLAPGEAFA